MYRKSSDIAALDEAVELFEACRSMRTDKFNKKLIRMIESDEFLHAIFKPNVNGDNATKAEISSKIGQVYTLANKASCVEAIVNAISDYGYRDISRSTAAFLTSLVNLGITNIDEKAQNIGREKDHDEISNRDYDKVMSKLKRYQDELTDLLDFVKKSVKSEANALRHQTGVPKLICTSAMYSIPDREYLDQYKVGFYLNTLLANIYGYVNLNPDEVEDFDDLDWKTFFTRIFGKERIPDIASIILLEGVNRISQYESKQEVRACWDSITQFALKALNQAPESIRDQMLELYLKRINKMLANHSIDLRVDLRAIDDFKFENLARTISKYKNKITDVMSRATALANAAPETSPVV